MPLAQQQFQPFSSPSTVLECFCYCGGIETYMGKEIENNITQKTHATSGKMYTAEYSANGETRKDRHAKGIKG